MGASAVRPKRMVYLDHDVDRTLTPIRKELTKLYAEDKNKPMLLVISSLGGSALGMFALLDRIGDLRARGATIHGLVEGYAMSAGLILLQATEHRMMGANATLMAHGITGGARGDLDYIESELDFMRADTRRVAEIFGRRTKRGADYWRRKFQTNRPLYYRADEALKIGLVDEVVGV